MKQDLVILESNSKSNKEKWIIKVETSVMMAIIKVRQGETKQHKEGENLYHSQMSMKGTLFHLMIPNNILKNIILKQIIKKLKNAMIVLPNPYTIRQLRHQQDIYVNQKCLLHYIVKPLKNEVVCDVADIEFFVSLLRQP